MAVTRFPQRGDGIADRMSGFIAHLRMNGLKLGPADTNANQTGALGSRPLYIPFGLPT